ncbi:MAG: hypothetical protein V4580_10190 [Bacteroidota bacterium]
MFVAIFYCSDFYSQVKNEEDLKKQAEQYFESEDYNLAYKLFAQLVSLYPKDPDYNYKLGVCMLFTEPDKKKPYSYLLIATKNPADAPKDAKFYLAKTYHVNYRFDEAIKLYTEYKSIGSAASVKRLQVDREIQACKNGKRLLSNLSDLVVITKKQLNEADYFKAYDVKEIGGKLLVKPDEYKSGYDKKKKDKSVVYLPRSGERLYYSSYGEGGGNGRDIYYVNKLPNGSWSKPTMLPTSVNTEFDEDYPFLHPNGKTLYFSSKGHNSMGGYDVFKTTFDVNTQSWSKPENLEFPINSPDDDILFVTDSLEKTAFFSTGRYSPFGKLDVLKINTERRPMNFAVMKGTVVKEEASQSIKSKVTVKNMANGEIVGSFQAGDNGDYNMELPNGGKFIFTVETPGIPTQSDGVNIPVAYTLKPYRQVISYDKKILKIINYFEGSVAEENYSMMIDLIEKKAKLEVNENEPYNNSLKETPKSQGPDGTKNLNSVSTNNPTIGTGNETNSTTAANTNKNVTNDQLLSIAKMDAKEASDEATKLKQDAQDAFGLATQKTAESVAIQKEADQAIENANTITDVTKKNEELAKANQLKEEAKIAAGVANTATNMAKKLEVDASIQQKEADLTNQYITQLETVITNKNNKEALTKLESIQKELDDISKQKNQSSELLTSLKAESELKKQELISSEKKSNNIATEITALKTESENLEKDLTNESDKSIKENIAAQIRELTSEIDIKNKDLITNNQKIDALKNQVEGVNQELQIAAKILNENPDGVAITTNTGNKNENSTALNTTTTSGNVKNSNTAIETSNTNNPSALSYEGITNKYIPKVTQNSIDNTNKESVTKQNDILKTYNKEVADLIAIDKNAVSKTTNAAEKKKLNDEIKNLEKLKIENDKAIANNNSVIKQIESNMVAANSNGNSIGSSTPAAENNNTVNNENGNNASKTSTTGISSNNQTTAESNNSISSASNNSTGTSTTTINSGNQTNTGNNNAIVSENNNSTATTTTGINSGNQTTTGNNNAIASENNTSTNTSTIGVNSGNQTTAGSNNTIVSENNTSSNTSTTGINSDSQTNTVNNNAIVSENNNSGATNSINANATNTTASSPGNIITSGNIKSTNNAGITNNAAANNDPVKSIDPVAGTDNAAFLNELNNLKTGLNSNTNAANQIFGYNDYKENTSIALKQFATDKFDASKRSETALNATIAKTETAIKNNSSAGGPEAMLTEADNLNNKAADQRKEAATKTGTEKDALLKQATENEKTSVDKKLAASVISEKQNKTKFDNNNNALTELQKLTGNKSNDAISQANLLVDEASLNFKQAQKLRAEAEAYPSGAAKLGGLSNAEEKENEALTKQQKALDILSKVNPTYQVKGSDAGTNPAEAIANLNNEINKTSQLQQDAYLALSKANQNELKLQNDKLLKNPTYKANTQAQELKASSDNLNNEAKAFIAQSVSAKTPAEKANLLLKANEKEIAAIITLNQAVELTKGNTTIATSNTTTNPANTDSVGTNATNKTSNPSTTSTTTVANTNSAVTNGNTENNNANTTIENNSNSSNTNSVAVNIENPSNTNLNSAINTNTVSTNTGNVGNTIPNNESASTSTVSSSSALNVSGNNVGDEAAKLKAGLNNPSEGNLLAYNSYKNSEAIAFKDQAAEKINAALSQDKQLVTALDNVSQLASVNSGGNSLTPEVISSLLSDAEKLNDDAASLRRSAVNKTGGDKDKDISDAKALEAKAIGKKVEAANKQQQLNKATFEANKQSLEELAQLVKGKDIPELSSADMVANEANLFLKQADKLREEANAYPSDGAKLGGYSNAEEKEFQALFKQQSLLDLYKKQFPNYTPKKANVSTDSPEAIAKLNETKSALSTNNQAHIEGLTLLSQANEKEYKSRFIALPSALNAGQGGIKTKAQAAYKKNQDFLTKANQSADISVKKNLLLQANTSGQEAISLLNQITTSNTVANNNTSDNNTATNNTATNNTGNTNQTAANTTTNNNAKNTATNNQNTAGNNTSTNNNSANTPVIKIKVEGLEVKNNNAYTADKPIPIDEKMPEGLVFKVQIGAFKAPLPNNTFKGLSPVTAQTTPNGYIRYMAGNFEQYGSANAVKNDLRNLGYEDAFVVAYYNGKRINLNEATDKAKAAGQTIDPAANTSAGLTNNVNVPKNVITSTTNTTTDTQPVEITNEHEKMNGLLYTVQIGVYSKQITRSQLYNLRPIYTEKMPNGLFRYTAGIYNQTGKIIEDKRKVVNLGVKDAFVTAYYNSKRIPYAEAQKLQTENNNLKMEAENPIVFAGGTNSVPATNSVVVVDMNTVLQPDNKPASAITPFSNGVTAGPTPTPENGVKTDDAGISFKVQIGAYKNQVPNEVASKFLNIKTWPVQNVVINGLYIYTIGNFTGISFAKKLRDEAKSIGIADAYITVYKDGKKLYGAEAAQYLSN